MPSLGALFTREDLGRPLDRRTGNEVFVRRSPLLWGSLLSTALTLLAPAAGADEGQRYPVAYVDRPLTLPQITLSPDVSFDATQLVKDPNAIERELTTNLAVMAGFGLGITEDLEVRASIGTLRFAPKFEYADPRVGVTYRFVGAEQFNMGVRAEATVIIPNDGTGGVLKTDGGVRFQASLPFLIRMGSSARLDLAPGAPVTIEAGKATTVGLDVPLAFAFQIVEPIHIGARTSAYITDFSSPGNNLVIPLGFFAGISLGSERPIVEIDPYFTWTDFARPGAKFDNDKVSIDKFSAGLTARLYLFL